MSTAKRTETMNIGELDERPLYRSYTSRKLTAEDLDSRIQANRIEGCIREILEIRRNFEAIDANKYDEQLTGSAPGRPWNEWQPERRILKQRFIERRHQLLNQVLTDLLDVIASDVILYTVDTELYSGHYILRELYDDACEAAVGKGE